MRLSLMALKDVSSSWPVTDTPTPHLVAERRCRVSKTIGLQASSRTVDFVTSLNFRNMTSPSIAEAKQRAGVVT
jgi:hypothetical protein